MADWRAEIFMLESRLLEATSLERCGSSFVPTNPQPSSINRLMKRIASIVFLLLAVVCFFAQPKGATANFVYQNLSPPTAPLSVSAET